MPAYTNETHDPKLRSWVESANEPGTDFPIQNLPFGAFTRHDLSDDDLPARIGVAIGDQVFDITQALESDPSLLGEGFEADFLDEDFYAGILNEFMSRSRREWAMVRSVISALLRHDNPRLRDDAELRAKIIVPQSGVEMLMPAFIGDYTDFYASKHHATNVGSMFRPDNPLMPNYTHLPVGYHGRASSIVVSGTDIRRPMGQTKADDADAPVFGPCRLLDYELEMGVFCGPANELGERISMQSASDHIFGMCIVNDWSARDIQKWEYQPLGPFNAKNFATSISPWIVTMDALAPFRVEGPMRDADDPPVLDYLQPVEAFGVDITVEVWIASATMREQNAEPAMLSRGNFRDMFWTIAQMLVHHTSTGCPMQPGDLIGSGTISGPTEDARGCLLERTWRGQNPIALPDGTERKFLQDGDEVIIRAYCGKEGAARIGFGECRGVVLPAK